MNTPTLTLWHIIRLPILALMTTLEPLFRIALSLLAFALAVVALFLRFTTEPPNFPFWGMLGCSVVCVLIMMGYSKVIQFLSS